MVNRIHTNPVRLNTVLGVLGINMGAVNAQIRASRDQTQNVGISTVLYIRTVSPPQAPA